MALAQLRVAFGKTHTSRQYQKILKEMFQNFGMTFMEIARIPKIDLNYLERWVTIAPGSEARLQAALAKGKGVIFLTGHFGNWELISITGALKGYASLVLARQQGLPRLNGLLTQYRESKGCRVVTKGFPIRDLIRGLQEGKIVGILADQDGGRNGVLAPFFGRLASTASGAVALSLNTGAPILPVFITRTRGPAHTLTVSEPLHIPEEGSLEVRVRTGISKYLAVLEHQVRKHPSQWLWLHRRWKSSPERRVLLFSDGKAGHESQMRGLAERIEMAWTARAQQDKRLNGWRDRRLLRTERVEVVLRHPLWRLILGGVASLAPRRYVGGERWLRWALTPESFSALESAYADISISCGAATAAVHWLWSRKMRSRAIHITRSQMPSWRRFDLAVLPRHDWVSEADASNLLVIDGALTPLPKVSPQQEEQLRKRLGCQRSRQLGLFLGGPAKGVTVTSKQVEQVVRSLLAACDALDAELLLTTSRRTPTGLERYLHETLKNHPRCRLLTLVNRGQAGKLKTTAEAVECILNLSDAVTVSGDSISMVSEAIARAKPVVGFYPEKTGFALKAPKYHRFLRLLESQGRIATAPAAQVGEAMAELVSGGAAAAPSLGARRGPRLLPDAEDPIVEQLKQWL